jgi:hypothetical protein
MNHVYALATGFAGAFLALGFAFEGAALPLTEAFKAAPAVNLGAFLATILISLPVRGVLLFLALRSDTENVPKPMRVTLSPLRNAWAMESVTTAMAFVTTVCDALISAAGFAASSVLVFTLIAHISHFSMS